MPNLSKFKPNGAQGTEYDFKDEVARQSLENKVDTSEVTEVDTPDTTPFLYRETPYEADRVFLDELVGADIVVNQLVENGNFADGTTGWTARNGSTANVNNGICTVTPGSANSMNFTQLTVSGKIGHKILVFASVKSSATIKVTMQNNIVRFSKQSSTSGNWEVLCGVYTSVENEEVLCFTNVTNTSAYDIKNIMCVDLTQSFGSDPIPNAAYTKEQTIAGSGIAWLKSYGFFTKEYYQYNLGTIESVNPSGKKIVGFNQWDEEWLNGYRVPSTGAFVSSNDHICSKNPISVLPNTAYYTMQLSGYVVFFDKELGHIGYHDANTKTFTTPSNCAYIHFNCGSAYGNTYKHDICINISKPTGSPKNGDYLPYEERTYPISQSPLRGLFTLVNDTIKASGDVRKSDGTHKVKFETITFDGSNDETWSTSSSWPVGCWYSPNALVNGFSVSGYSTRANIISDVGATFSPQSIADGSRFGVGQGNGTSFYLRVDNTLDTEAKLRTYLSNNPITVYYELATPTTEQLTPFVSPQVCYRGGTEEFIDNRDVPVPVGHNSRYADLPAIMEGDYLSYMARNFASEEYVDRAIEVEISDLGFSIVNGKLCQTYNI